MSSSSRARIIITSLTTAFIIIVFFIFKESLIPTAHQSIIHKSPSQHQNLSHIIPIPESLDLSQHKINLGEKLFFDPRLSRDSTIACVSCHFFDHATADNRPVSIGIDNQKGELNSSPIFNAKFNIAQFWDGRAKDLFEQAHAPLINPVEMGNSNLEAVVKRLKKIDEYSPLFSAIYDDGITLTNIIDAIVEYEESLVTPNSRFDQYLKGNTYILTEAELEGYRLFKNLGCVACHNGVNIGGNIF